MNKPIEKMFRIIKPIERYKFTEWFGVKKGYIFYDETTVKDGNTIHGESYLMNEIKFGDIVDFRQLEKWVEMGLHPIYFTEEVAQDWCGADHWMNAEQWRDSDSRTTASCVKDTGENVTLKNIIDSGYYIDNYNLQGFFIETNEEDDKLIREIKGIENED